MTEYVAKYKISGTSAHIDSDFGVWFGGCKIYQGSNLQDARERLLDYWIIQARMEAEGAERTLDEKNDALEALLKMKTDDDPMRDIRVKL